MAGMLLKNSIHCGSVSSFIVHVYSDTSTKDGWDYTKWAILGQMFIGIAILILPGNTLPCQGLEMITFIIYNPWLQTSFLLISDYLENPVLEVLSKFSTSHNTANIYGSGAGSY